MNKAEQVKSLLQGIQQDRQHYRQLQLLLQQQRAQMIARNCNELDSTNQQLEQYYQLLETSAIARNTVLKSLGIPANAQGIELLLSKLPEPHQQKARAMWADLEYYASECYALNERNGLLLNMQLDVLQPLLHKQQPDFLYSG